MLALVAVLVLAGQSRGQQCDLVSSCSECAAMTQCSWCSDACVDASICNDAELCGASSSTMVHRGVAALLLVGMVMHFAIRTVLRRQSRCKDTTAIFSWERDLLHDHVEDSEGVLFACVSPPPVWHPAALLVSLGSLCCLQVLLWIRDDGTFMMQLASSGTCMVVLVLWVLLDSSSRMLTVVTARRVLVVQTDALGSVRPLLNVSQREASWMHAETAPSCWDNEVIIEAGLWRANYVALVPAGDKAATLVRELQRWKCMGSPVDAPTKVVHGGWYKTAVVAVSVFALILAAMALSLSSDLRYVFSTVFWGECSEVGRCTEMVPVTGSMWTLCAVLVVLLLTSHIARAVRLGVVPLRHELSVTSESGDAREDHSSAEHFEQGSDKETSESGSDRVGANTEHAPALPQCEVSTTRGQISTTRGEASTSVAAQHAEEGQATCDRTRARARELRRDVDGCDGGRAVTMDSQCEDARSSATSPCSGRALEEDCANAGSVGVCEGQAVQILLSDNHAIDPHDQSASRISRWGNTHRNISRGEDTHQNMSRGEDTHQNMSRGGDTHQNMPRGENTHQNMSRGDTHQNMSRGEDTHQYMSRGEDTHQNMSRGENTHQYMSRENTHQHMSRGEDTHQYMSRGGDTQNMSRGEDPHQNMSRENTHQYMSRGEDTHQYMSRGENTHQNMSRGEDTHENLSRGENTHQNMSRGETHQNMSTQNLSRGEDTHQNMPRGEDTHQNMSRGDTHQNMSRGGDTHENMSRGRGESTHQNMSRGEDPHQNMSTQNLSRGEDTHQNMPRGEDTHQNMSRGDTHQNMSRGDTHQNMSRGRGESTHQNMSRGEDPHQNMPRGEDTHQNMSRGEDTHQSISKREVARNQNMSTHNLSMSRRKDTHQNRHNQKSGADPVGHTRDDSEVRPPRGAATTPRGGSNVPALSSPPRSTRKRAVGAFSTPNTQVSLNASVMSPSTPGTSAPVTKPFIFVGGDGAPSPLRVSIGQTADVTPNRTCIDEADGMGSPSMSNFSMESTSPHTHLIRDLCTAARVNKMFWIFPEDDDDGPKRNSFG